MKRRILSSLMALVLVFGLLPATAFAEGDAAPAAAKKIYVDAINGNDTSGDGTNTAPFKTAKKAVIAAASGDTIQLAAGCYSLYEVCGKDDKSNSKEYTKNKDLTFIGAGPEETKWGIGAKVPDPTYFGTEYNGDYSFDGAGTITFQNMTLQSGSADYLGFIRADNTVVENCTINGKTFYWGYESATFTNTTFNCPSGDYAIWTYSSPTMTFDSCTFNSSGKVINVYTDYSAGKHDITVNFMGCTVNNTVESLKPVLNINDSNMGSFKYRLNISGNTTVTGVDVDRDTCSRLFGFGGKATKNNKGKTIVKFGNTTVWQDGKMVNKEAYHTKGVTVDGVTYGNGVDGANDSLYAEGYKDNKFTTNEGTWTIDQDGNEIRTITKTCDYCGYQEKTIEYKPIGGDDGDDDKYFFAIQKVDAQDGHALNGATFELYQLDKNGKVDNRSVTKTRQQGSKNGIALFSVDNKNSYDGIWYYAEVTAPEGYVLDSTEHKIKATDFSDSLSTAVSDADTVRNYRGTTPDLLNDSDHFAYVIGYMDGNVRPYGLISRAETTTIFFRLLKDSVRDGNLLTSNTYTDVADDYWANTAISTMTGLGIVQGRSTTTFDPKAPITRAQFAAICARFDTGKSSGTQTFTDIKGHWAEKYIQRAAELGWIKGFEDGTFRPDTYITRAQAMTMINRVLNRIPEDESDLLPGMNVWPDCNPGDWFYLAVQEATNSHDFEHKAGNYETWTGMNKNPDWTRYEH